MHRNLILSGGVAHDYAATSSMLRDILSGETMIESEITEDLSALTTEILSRYDLLTLNCVRWTCSQTPEWYGEWHCELPDATRQAIRSHLAQGKGLLALHAATICFDDWPEYAQILGARWDWGVSGHAPLQEQPMRVADDTHPITRGVSDFRIVDELYTRPVLTVPLQPLVVADWDGSGHPILWARDYGPARVCYNALGHGPEAFAHPINQTLLRRAALWCTRRLDGAPTRRHAT